MQQRSSRGKQQITGGPFHQQARLTNVEVQCRFRHPAGSPSRLIKEPRMMSSLWHFLAGSAEVAHVGSTAQ